MLKSVASAHAHEFLDRIDEDGRLRSAALIFHHMEHKGPPDFREWKNGELRRWCLDEAESIAGTKKPEDIVANGDVLTLAALGYLAAAKIDDPSSPKSAEAPTPSRLRELESGFLRALLHQAERRAAASKEFGEKLEAAKARVSRLIDSIAKPANPPAPGGASVSAQAQNNGWAVIDVLAVICAVAYVVGKLTKNKK